MIIRANCLNQKRPFATSTICRQLIPKSYGQSFPNRYQNTRKRLELNNLSKIITSIIKKSGPITLSQYIKLCSSHPEHGFQATTKNLVGWKSDFITAPEISQMYGEMIGIWFFTIWLHQGKPQNINFIDINPERGILIFDILKSFSSLLRLMNIGEDGFHLNALLIEDSHAARRQQYVLNSSSDLKTTDANWTAEHKWGGKITWMSHQDFSKAFLDEQGGTDTAHYTICNEYLSSLPINRFVKTSKGWREFLVNTNVETNDLLLQLSEVETKGSKSLDSHKNFKSLPLNTSIEISPGLPASLSQIINSITQKGAALIIDYGSFDEIPASSLKSISNQKISTPFQLPGEAQLSSDVDFITLKNHVLHNPKVVPFGPKEQGEWLHQLGIHQRADQLYRQAKTETEKELIQTGYERLVEHEGFAMGQRFKMLAILPHGSNRPLGFKK